eukprot:jgi/Astpho2/8390/Aster-x0808
MTGPATTALLQTAALSKVSSVFEFGCGAGGLAARLLAAELPQAATYFGVDQSSTMTELAQARLQKFGSRGRVQLVSGDPLDAGDGLADGSCDVFLSTYVLDLLSEEDVAAVLQLAWR